MTEKLSKKTLLHLASEKTNAELQQVIQMLLSRDCDVNAKDSQKKTPLHIACMKGNKEVVRMLLEKNALPDEQMLRFRATPLHLAVFDGNTDIVRLLLAKNPDLNGTHIHA